jgi:chorismate dehydratase
MINKRISISFVSYSNTLPFVYGLANQIFEHPYIIWEDYPSLSAKRVMDEDVDIALVPVGVLPQLKYYNIFGDLCIGANGTVDSVILFSNDPIHQIKNIILDYQSTTSNKLLRLLCRDFWKVQPNFTLGKAGYESESKAKQGQLIIGDRALLVRNTDTFRYQYDLADVWKQWTGLPFVFAVWISINPNIEKAFIAALNEHFQFGVSNIKSVCSKYHEKQFDLKDYLSNKISYDFDESKKQALTLFLEKISTLD